MGPMPPYNFPPCVRASLQPTPKTFFFLIWSHLSISVLIYKPNIRIKNIHTYKNNCLQSFYMRAAVTAIANHRLLPVLQSFQTSITSNRNRIIVRNIMSEPRLVTKKVLAKHQREGDGAVVRRCIGRFLKLFLCLCLSGFCFLFFSL